MGIGFVKSHPASFYREDGPHKKKLINKNYFGEEGDFMEKHLKTT